MIQKRILQLALSLVFLVLCGSSNGQPKKLSQQKMEAIYKAIKTPFKYGVVFKYPDAYIVITF